MTDTRPLPPNLTEKAFQSLVLDLAAVCGWRSYHTHDSRHSSAGFPDLVLVRRGHLVFVELKTETGAVTPDQLAWLDELAGVPAVIARLWRPSDWPEIQEALT